MAATALIKFAQDTVGTGGDGIAFLGVTNQLVTVTNSVNANVQSWQIDLVYVDPQSAVTPATPYAFSDNGDTPTATFTPDVRRSYRFVLKVWDVPNRAGTPSSIDIRNFAVPEFNGIIVPPVQIWPPPLPDPASNKAGAKPNELNFDGQSGGWAGTGTDGLFNSTLTKLFVTSTTERWVDQSTPIAFSKQNGSRNLPYQSIQQALNDVATIGGNNSTWTIYVAPGAYNEGLTLTSQRKVVIFGTDYATTTLNIQSNDNIYWDVAGLSYLALKNIKVNKVTMTGLPLSPPISPNTGTLYLQDASLEEVTQDEVFTLDVVGVGPNTYVENADIAGRFAMDGVDHVGDVTCASLALYNTLIPGSTLNVSGDASIVASQLDPGSTLNMVGYSQTLHVDGISNYWLDASNVVITGSPSVVVMGASSGTLFPGKEVGTTSYTLVAEDASKVVYSSLIDHMVITVPQNSSVPFPIGTVIYFQQKYLGTITLLGGGASVLLSRTTRTTSGQGSVIWAVKTEINTWALGGDLIDAVSPYPWIGASNYLDYTNYGRLTTVTESTTTTVVVPTHSFRPFPVGSKFDFVAGGTGQVVFTGEDGSVTIRTAETLKLRKQWSAGTLTKLANNEWLLVGDLELAS